MVASVKECFVFDRADFEGCSRVKMVKLGLPKAEVERYSRQILVDEVGVKGKDEDGI